MSSLRGQTTLGRANVGSTTNKINRNTNQGLRRRLGDVPHNRQLVVQRRRFTSDQDAKAIDRDGQTGLKQRQFRFRGRQVGLRLTNIQFGHKLGIKLHLGQDQCFLLELDIPLRRFDLALKGAYVDVGRSHLGQQADQHTAVIFHRGSQNGVRRFDIPPNAAEHVDLPGGIKARGIEVHCFRIRESCGGRSQTHEPAGQRVGHGGCARKGGAQALAESAARDAACHRVGKLGALPGSFRGAAHETVCTRSRSVPAALAGQ